MKKYYFFFKIIFSVFLIFSFFRGYSQLNINTTLTPAQLVQNVLIGSGVTVSNVTFNGPYISPGAIIGSFTTGSTPTNLGLSSGIVMASGFVDASNGEYPIGSPASDFNSGTTNTGSDPDLAGLIPGYTILDATVLEFDFIPLADTLKFRYVFGSEEYPEYVSSSFNDAFGFFISGPNPAGGNYTNKNIAIIPGTTLPVSIDGINNVIPSYPQYYVDNQGIGGTTIVYDGFTTVLTAWCLVTPCVSYHIKIAIGDAGDSAFDSAVFLEAYSFSSNSVNVTPTYSNISLGNNAIEGCSNGIFAFTTSIPVTSPMTINYTIGGTATNGVDYPFIGNSVTIPVGSDSVAVVISPFIDGLTEGSETVTLSITNGCTTMVYTINIIDNVALALTASGATTICPGGSATLSVTATGGITPYTYNWSSGGGTGSTATFSPANTTTYTVTVSDFCGQTETANQTITVVNNFTVTVSPTNPFICSGSSVSLTATSNGTGTTFTWSPATGLSSTTGATVTASPTTITTYTVTGNSSGCTGLATVTVDIISISATATSTNENCGQANGTATVTASGNCTTGFTYQWGTVPIQTTTTASNLPQGNYTVSVYCGLCMVTASTTVTNLPGPSVSIASIINTTCGQANGGATASASGGNIPYNYLWSNGQSGQNLTNVPAGIYYVTVTDINGCQAINTVTITGTPGPSASISTISNAACGFSDGSATITPSGGTPSYTYFWSNSSISQTLMNVPAGLYYVTVTDANGCTTSVSANIGEDPGPTATASSTNEICDHANGTATVNASGGTGTYTYLWSDGQTTATATGLVQGSYSVTVSDGGCSTVEMANVLETPGPDAGFSANPNILTMMDGPVSFLDNSSGNIVTWDWNFGDGSANGSGNELEHTFENLGTFLVTLIVTDNNGCMDTIQDTIKVKEIYTFYIPNTFTPNGDDINDLWAPKGLSVDPDNFEMYIFDRWGKLMFHTSKWFSILNQSEPWNGTMNNDGTFNDIVMDVYAYRIRVKEVEGPKHEYFGRITLAP